jgi:hypothetical protein
VRGLRAPLSPREETALLRVARGGVFLQDLASEHLRRLTLLELVQEIDGKLALTELGREPHSVMLHQAGRDLAAGKKRRAGSPAEDHSREHLPKGGTTNVTSFVPSN